MLLPALNKAREQARVVNCASNMRQSLMGLRLYAHDRPKQGFPWIHGLQGQRMCWEWIQAIIDGKYIRGEGAFQCTADPGAAGFGPYRATWDLNAGWFVPTDKRNGAWFLYTARARGCLWMGSNGGPNVVVAFGYWAPCWIMIRLS